MVGFCDSLCTADDVTPILAPQDAPVPFFLALSQVITFSAILVCQHRRRAAIRARPLRESEQVELLPVYSWFISLLLAFSLASAVALSSSSLEAGAQPQSLARSIGSSFIWGLAHVLQESVAIFLMQHSSGAAAFRRAFCGGLVAGAVTWAALAVTFYYGRAERQFNIGAVAFLLWNSVAAVYYGALCFLPASVLFRRPALRGYAIFFGLVRILPIMAELVRLLSTSEIQLCLQLSTEWLLLSPALPLVVYKTLLADSQYWSGSRFNHAVDSQGSKQQLIDADIRSPLAGNTFGAAVVSQVNDALEGLHKRGVPLINFTALTLPNTMQLLGAGGTARVYCGEWGDTQVAVKMIFCVELTLREVDSFRSEASLLHQLRSPHIVQVMGVCVAPPALCLVLELCDADLHTALQQPCTMDQRLIMATQCSRAVEFLHTRQPIVLHKDIKSLNFLVSRNGVVKLTDFGMSQDGLVADSEHDDGWTLAWAAPELLTGDTATQQSDVYALAITVWECLTSELPFEQVLHYLDRHIIKGSRPPLQSIWPGPIQQLLTRGWSPSTIQRPAAAEFSTLLPTLMGADMRSQSRAEHAANILMDPANQLVQDRQFHMRMYRNCLVGKEVVDFFVLHPMWSTELQLTSRQDCVQMGELMVASGILQHVVGEHNFKDEYLFYTCML